MGPTSGGAEPLRKSAGKLARLQRRLARKTKFGANWRTAKARIGRLHHRIANQRKGFLHNPSAAIAKSHGIVKVEKRQVQTMSKSAEGTLEASGGNVRQKSGLNRSIRDQGWPMFRTFLRYKLAERGGTLVEVDPAYTSQTCPECGVVDRASRRDQAGFVCVACGHSANADTNAAKHVHQASAIAVEPPKRILRRVGKRKQWVGVSRANS